MLFLRFIASLNRINIGKWFWSINWKIIWCNSFRRHFWFSEWNNFNNFQIVEIRTSKNHIKKEFLRSQIFPNAIPTHPEMTVLSHPSGCSLTGIRTDRTASNYCRNQGSVEGLGDLSFEEIRIILPFLNWTHLYTRLPPDWIKFAISR